MMGDIRILKEQLEIGVPLESAAILAGYEFEEIESLKDDSQVKRIIAEADASFISHHLLNISEKSDDNPRMSAWLLERRFPEHFSVSSRNLEKDEVPKEVVLRGVSPDAASN
jgi:hypothetical protein